MRRELLRFGLFYMERAMNGTLASANEAPASIYDKMRKQYTRRNMAKSQLCEQEVLGGL